MQTIKHGGGNIMVWGCFGGGQVESIAKIDGKMTKQVYLKILKEHVLVCGTKLIGERFVFQQDNDPKHTAKVVKQYLNEKQEEGLMKVMTWPPQSPDCNPIELLWDHLDQEVRKTPEEYFKKLIDRMPRICQAIVKAKGGHFDEKMI